MTWWQRIGPAFMYKQFSNKKKTDKNDAQKYS